jgi:hypothetical protein
VTYLNTIDQSHQSSVGIPAARVVGAILCGFICLRSEVFGLNVVTLSVTARIKLLVRSVLQKRFEIVQREVLEVVCQ